MVVVAASRIPALPVVLLVLPVVVLVVVPVEEEVNEVVPFVVVFAGTSDVLLVVAP
jgi:hypothetical protein